MPSAQSHAKHGTGLALPSFKLSAVSLAVSFQLLRVTGSPHLAVGNSLAFASLYSTILCLKSCPPALLVWRLSLGLCSGESWMETATLPEAHGELKLE